MAVKNLVDRWVRSVRPPPRPQQRDYFDAKVTGLCLRVSYGGAKAWYYLYRFNGRKTRALIGRYPAIQLKAARDRAKDFERQAAKGINPAAERSALRRSESFEELAQEFLERHSKEKKRTWREDERLLNKDILPHLGRHKARDIKRQDIIRLLDRIKARAPVMANRALQLLRKMFNWAISREMLELNPCAQMELPTVEKERARVLTAEEIARLWEALKGETSLAADAIRLLLLTGQRRGEVLKMRWLDLDPSTEWQEPAMWGEREVWWTQPAEVAKNGVPHRVPLSGPAVQILRAIRGRHGYPVWVFPRRDGDGPATGELLRKPSQRVRKTAHIEDAELHDLRRTVGTSLTGLGFPRLTVSKLLNHAEAGITSIYDRHAYDGEKLEALRRWGERVMEIVGEQPIRSNVVAVGPRVR